MSRQCARCEVAVPAPTSAASVSLPPVCVPLLDGGDDVEYESILGAVDLALCERCARRVEATVAEEGARAALRDCTADAATWTTRAELAGDGGRRRRGASVGPGAATPAPDDHPRAVERRLLRRALGVLDALERRDDPPRRADRLQALLVVGALDGLGRLDAE